VVIQSLCGVKHEGSPIKEKQENLYVLFKRKTKLECTRKNLKEKKNYSICYGPKRKASVP